MRKLHCTVVPAKGGSRYRLFDRDDNLVIESGIFASADDSRNCGEHFAADPDAVFDFVERTTP